ncbi:hypothetical protein BC939DRAFT_481775 [Gamsiella multidivaricata]|uniref:uncharacterized protein n=1 Tax=Gamsiella multidivaricata TaxID=101098 RepID=UPI002220BD37|nr:uncharacterized protein BC939DRAFT_481775 [Gamsiella multidivaricata]KAI7816754.1 hypothetical protein BC939DRAFT_481775 [Gamsiella multidivaricata]
MKLTRSLNWISDVRLVGRQGTASVERGDTSEQNFGVVFCSLFQLNKKTVVLITRYSVLSLWDTNYSSIQIGSFLTPYNCKRTISKRNNGQTHATKQKKSNTHAPPATADDANATADELYMVPDPLHELHPLVPSERVPLSFRHSNLDRCRIGND